MMARCDANPFALARMIGRILKPDCPSRQRERSSGSEQSPGHSAHLGQDVVVHYRWHPLFGRRVGLRRSEQRSSWRFVQIEAEPGVVTIVAAWMLEPVACAGMEIGPRRVSAGALLSTDRHPFARGDGCWS